MEYLSTKYGLVTDEDFQSENGQLFIVTYSFLLKHFNQDKQWLELVNDYTRTQLMRSSTGIKGLYHRNPDLTDRRIMSHDNILAIMCWSKVNNTFHRYDIWHYLVTHGGLYDNTQGKTTQLSRFLPYSPQTMLILGLCAESKLIYLLFPILFPIFLINTILDCYKPKEQSTSKIIDWITFEAIGNIWYIRPLKKFFEKRMKKQYGNEFLVGLMDTFHGKNSKEFSINKLLGIGV